MPAPLHQILEVDAVRPTSEAERRQLRRRDSYQYGYGGGKLACEEALRALWQKQPFPYTALRVADVVGPFDNLGSHLTMQQRLVQGCVSWLVVVGVVGGNRGTLLVALRDVVTSRSNRVATGCHIERPLRGIPLCGASYSKSCCCARLQASVAHLSNRGQEGGKLRGVHRRTVFRRRPVAHTGALVNTC